MAYFQLAEISVEHTPMKSVILDAMVLMWRQWNLRPYGNIANHARTETCRV